MVYRVVGLMSGTSMDGLDIGLCTFTEKAGYWSFVIDHGETRPFPPHLAEALAKAHTLSASELVELSISLGAWCGETAKEVVGKHHFEPLLIASHGHTVFHQPEKSMTLQIGHGDVMAKAAGIPVVCDFRTADVFLEGQGAPLVPIGDRMLFREYDACLNLGGIANISYEQCGRQLAFDICPANMLLNLLAGRDSKAYDLDGGMAASGQLISGLSDQLGKLPYYKKSPPKSLSREMVFAEWVPLLDDTLPLSDLLFTCCEHIAIQIAKVVRKNDLHSVLVTGGGAMNKHLVRTMQQHARDSFVLPALSTIHYKEALVFGFLGLLRWMRRPNVLSSVTGAMKDHCSGMVALP